MRQYMYSSHVLYLGFTQVIWTHGIAVWQIRLRKYKTQTGYMSPYYLSKAYITNNVKSMHFVYIYCNPLILPLIFIYNKILNSQKYLIIIRIDGYLRQTRPYLNWPFIQALTGIRKTNCIDVTRDVGDTWRYT